MKQEIEFTKAQEAALSLSGKDILVSAAAGSGKTRVLIERIIRHLLDEKDPVSLSEILVVTFTKNATNELKSRVAKALNKALEKDPGNERLSRELLLLGSAQISTIDAFLQKIVRENFDTFGIPRMFRIISDEEEFPIAERVMQNVLDFFYQSSAITQEKELFSSLEKNKFVGAMDSLLNPKNEEDLRNLLLEFRKQFLHDPSGIERLKKSAKRLKEEAELPYFETRAGKILKRYTEEWFTRISEKPSHKVAAFCSSFGEALDGGYETTKAALAEYPGTQKSVAKLQKFYSSFGEDIVLEKRQSAELAEQLYHLYSTFEKQLAEEKQSRGLLTFGDVTTFAYQLLKPLENGEPSPAARACLEKYREIYIDEYQDVNRIQDEIFRIFGEGRRFMVGDIKQSIYRFRGGDPQVFADYRKAMPSYDLQGAQNAPGVSVFMRENFRCNRPIIDTVNQICSNLFIQSGSSWEYRRETDNLVFHKNRESDQEQKPVKIHLFPKSNGDIKPEHRFVADEIDRLLHDENEKKDNGDPIHPQDIVILVRANNQAKPYLKALRAKGIKVDLQTDKDDEVDPDLIDLLNLLFVIDNPYKDLPLLEFLQSPFAGFTLEEVARIRQFSERSYSLYDALERYSADDKLLQKVHATLAFLEEQRRNATSLPVDRFLRRLYESPVFAWLKDSDVSIYLYDQARQYASNAYVGLFEFLRYFEKLLGSNKLPANGFSKETEAVRICTIHKSKGEEYPIVFVSSLGAAFFEQELRDTVFYSDELGFSAKLFHPEALIKRTTTDCEIEKRLLREKNREESIRLLYVAMTRAKERLYLTGTPPQSAYAQAKEIRATNDRTLLLSASTPIPWLLAFLEEGENLPYCVDDKHTLDEIAYAEPAESGEVPVNPETDPADESEPVFQAQSVLHRLPSKVAASKIAPDLFDRILADDEEVSLETRLELLRSADSFAGFLAEQKKPGATDYGTATHAFLEFCDFHALAEKGPRSEAERLAAQGFLAVESLPLIRYEYLEKFRKSTLFAKILSAKQVRREQQFARLIPMAELTKDPALKEELKGERIFVQGSMDLILETEEGLALVDYKTDHLLESETIEAFRARMLKRHAAQLLTYARALEQLFSKKPSSVCLYSLPLGKTLEFSMEELSKQ